MQGMNAHTPSPNPDTLPIWMQRALRGTDWGILLVVAFALIAASPFFFRQGIPVGMNFERYTFRTADMAQSMREGTLYPRWTDEALGGYGAPLPHFTPPLPGLLGGAIDLLIVANAPVSTTVVFVIALVGAGMAIYAWIAQRMGAAGGLTTALLYLFNPVISQTIPHHWGDLKLMLCAALLPSLLWSVDRLLRRARGGDVALSGLLIAAMLLTDPISGLSGMLLAVCVCIIPHRTLDQHIGLRLVSALGIGTALAACFWLPAWIESGAVIWLVPEINPALLIDPRQLFTLPAPPDPLAIMPLPFPAVGIVGLMAALTGLPLIRRFQPVERRFFISLWAALIVISVLILFLRDSLWLLIPLSVSLSAAAGAPLVLRRALSPALGRILTLALCAIAIGSTAPLWLSGDSATNESEQDFSSAGQVAYEQRGYGVAVASAGQPVPSSIPAETPPDPSLIRGYLAGRPSRLVALNSDVQIGTLSQSGHAPRFQVSAFSAGAVRVMMGGFPGWSATLAQRPVPLIAEPDSPFALIPLEAGERGELVITLGTTPPRALGWVLTWIGLGGVGALLIRRPRAVDDDLADFPLLTHAETRLFTVLLIGVCLLLALARTQPDLARLLGWLPEPGSGLVHAQPRALSTDAGLQLIGMQAAARDQMPEHSFTVTLFWRALRRIDLPYRVQMALRDATTGRILFTLPVRHPGHLPASRWLARRYIRDVWQITLPAGIAPGTYDLVVSAFTCLATCDVRQSLVFFDENGTPLGAVIPIGQQISVQTR